MLHDPNIQMKCGKENYVDYGKGRLHCFSLTNLTSLTFCDTGTVKTYCTTTVAKTMKLFNGWVPKPKLHLQVTNKTLRNHKKEAEELLGWQALSLLSASDRKKQFQISSFHSPFSLRNTHLESAITLYIKKVETSDAEIKHTFTLTYKRKFNSSTRVNHKSFFFFLKLSGLTSQWFRINFLLPSIIFKSQKASFSLKSSLNPHKNDVEKRDE